MTAPFQHVSPGDAVEPPADDWNAMVDAARAHVTNPPDRGQAPRGIPTHARVVNTSDEQLPAYLPVQLFAPAFQVAEGDLPRPGPIVFEVKPYLFGRWAVPQHDIASGAVGSAVLAGVTWARVTVQQDGTPGNVFGPVRGSDGVVKIRRAGTGASLLWHPQASTSTPSGGGIERWAVVELGPTVRPRFLVRLVSTSDAGYWTAVEADPATTRDLPGGRRFGDGPDDEELPLLETNSRLATPGMLVMAEAFSSVADGRARYAFETPLPGPLGSPGRGKTLQLAGANEAMAWDFPRAWSQTR